MSKLPFLEENKLPKLRKLSGVSKYGFSEEEALIDHALEHVMLAIQSKNHKNFIEALKTLIEVILSSEEL